MRNLTSKAALIVLTIVTLVLLTANNLFFKGARLDLTEDRMFSVSEGTGNVLRSLESDVDLTFYYSEEDSAELGFLRDYARRIIDLLDEYALRAEGRLNIEVIDPAPFSEQEDQANILGLQRITLGFGEEPIFFGMVAQGSSDESDQSEQSEQSENTELIQFLHPDREEFLEYDLTRMLLQVSRSDKAKLGLVSGVPFGGGFDQVRRAPSPPWQTYTQLRELYEIENFALDVADIPDDIDLLLLVHPAHATEQTLYAIDQYVMRGGTVLAFVDEFAQTDPLLSLAATAGTDSDAKAGGTNSKLLPLMQSWGVELMPGKVLADAQHALRVGGGSTGRPTPHPGVFGYGPDNFVEPDHPVLNQLNTVIFSSSAVLQPLDAATTDFDTLVQSSERSGLLDAALLQNLSDPAQLTGAFEESGERYPVVAHITGPAISAFPDGKPVVEENSDENGAADESAGSASASDSSADTTTSPPAPDRPYVAESSADGINVFIVADSDVLHDPLWVRVNNFFGQEVAQPFADNGNFFFNAVENLIGSKDLMGLRSRGSFGRPFHVVEALERDAATRFQDKERELQQRLQQTESRLAELQSRKEGEDALALNAEQEQEVAQFRSQQLSIRRELRDVRHQLNQDIENLGGWIKLINILLVPLLITAIAVFLGFRQRAKIRRSNKINMAAAN